MERKGDGEDEEEEEEVCCLRKVEETSGDG